MAEAAVAVIDAVLELVSEQGKMAKLSASVLRCDCYPVCGPFLSWIECPVHYNGWSIAGTMSPSVKRNL